MIVVDASVLAPALVDDGANGARLRARLLNEVLAAPALIDVEVGSVLRRHALSGAISAQRASLALDDLLAIPIERASHSALLPRCWELRDNLTVYDATYVALAELLHVKLVTADSRLAHAPGVRCSVEILRNA